VQLDLRHSAKLSVAHTRLITDLEPSVRASYNAYIGHLAKANHLQGTDWLARASCRNTIASLIHEKFCRLRLLDTLLERDEVPDLVLVGSKSMYLAVGSVLEKHQKRFSIQIQHEGGISVFRNLLQSLRLLLNLFIWPKIIRKTKNLVEKKSFIYLDTFVSPDSFAEDGCFKDRYYPGFLESLDKKMRDKVILVPSYYGVGGFSRYRRLFTELRRSSINFLVKEDYLTTFDFLVIFFKSFFIPSKIKKIPPWRGIDTTAIVQDEVLRDRFSPDLVNALLVYRFVKQLKNNGFEPELVIDWNENQVMDRALNLAVREEFPQTPIKGYQSYVVPNFYACIQPTEYELAAGTIPHELCLIGKAYQKDRLEFCPSLKSSIAPAYRFLHIYDSMQKRRTTKQFEILIALPMMVDEAKVVIEVCLPLSQKLGDQYSLKMKLHPTQKPQDFHVYQAGLQNSKIEWVQENTGRLLQTANLIITSTSSICFEAVMIGVFVAIVSNRSGPVMNPIPNGLNPELYRICYEELDILDFIDKLQHLKTNFDFSMEDYLCPMGQGSLI
jgi:hypothetical protein